MGNTSLPYLAFSNPIIISSYFPVQAGNELDNRKDVDRFRGGVRGHERLPETRNQKKLVKMFSDMREIRRDGSSPSLTSDRSPGSPGSIAPGSPSNPSIKNYASERGKKGRWVQRQAMSRSQ